MAQVKPAPHGWGVIRRRAAGYQVDIWVATTRVRQTYPSRELADDALRDLRRAKAAGTLDVLTRSDGLTYGAVIPDLLEELETAGLRPRTLSTYRYELEQVREHWADRSIAATRPRDVRRWIAALQRRKVSSSTIRHLCDRLSQLHAHAEENELLDVRPCKVPRPKLVSPARAAIAEDDLALLVERARLDFDRRPLVILLLAADAGLRESEIVALQGGDVADGWIHVRDGKGGQARRVPVLTERLRDALATVATDAGKPLLGLTARGQANRLVRRRVWQHVLPGRTCDLHALRHRFATVALGVGGVAPDDVRQWLGHGELRTTARYTHERTPTVPDELRAALGRMSLDSDRSRGRRSPGGHRRR